MLYTKINNIDIKTKSFESIAKRKFKQSLNYVIIKTELFSFFRDKKNLPQFLVVIAVIFLYIYNFKILSTEIGKSGVRFYSFIDIDT